MEFCCFAEAASAKVREGILRMLSESLGFGWVGTSTALVCCWVDAGGGCYQHMCIVERLVLLLVSSSALGCCIVW